MNDHEHFIIDSEYLFDRLVVYSEQVDSEFLALDTETDSAIEKLANLYGISLCFTLKKAFYIVWRDKSGKVIWSVDQINKITSWLKSICQKKKIIMHNGVYDVLVLENNIGLYLAEQLYHDTILSAHCINEEGDLALKDLGVQYFGASAEDEKLELLANIELNGGKTTKTCMEMFKADTNTLGKYACKDAILTLALFFEFENKLKQEGLDKLYYEDEIMPLYQVTINMKRKGFPVDVPYYLNLKEEITKDIYKLDSDIYELIKQDIEAFESKLLNEEFPIKTTGNFPKFVSEVLGLPLPKNSKTGTLTLAKKAVELQKEQVPDSHKIFYDWILEIKGIDITSPAFKVLYTKKGDFLKETQMRMWKHKYNSDRVFNLNSNDHLIELVYNVWGFPVSERTPKGKPKIDDDSLELITGNVAIDKLKEYKKLNKLLSTYVVGILDRQIDGIIYTSMLQFGTTSARYASRNPNLNNLPAIKKELTIVDKYTNAIRKGLVAPKGKKIIGCDFNSLEPHIAAYVSGDKGLIDIFVKGEDFYSAIGIKQFKITDATPYKDDTPNSFPVKYKELRNKIKTYALAGFYGATASRISEILQIPYKEANDLLEGYFNEFPKIKNYINNCHYQAKTTGIVKNKVGRIRHLKEARSIYTLYSDSVLDIKYAKKNGLQDIRRKYRNLLNNSVNFGIQSLAASCLNRSMILMTKEFKDKNIDAYIGLSVHDEVLVIAKEEQVDICSKIVKDCMENCIDLSPIKLKATPIIGNNYGECK